MLGTVYGALALRGIQLMRRVNNTEPQDDLARRKRTELGELAEALIYQHLADPDEWFTERVILVLAVKAAELGLVTIGADADKA